MAVLTYSQISDLALDNIQANVSTDAPFTSAQIARHINDAYSQVWEISGGRVLRYNHADAWSDASLAANGVLTSDLTNINEIIEVFASGTSGSTGDVITNSDTTLDPVEFDELLFYRQSQTLFGSYARPKVYSVQRNEEIGNDETQVNKVRVDVWPVPSGTWYIPIHIVPQFTEIDSSTFTTPNVNDSESRDIAWIAASTMAPLIGRSELVPGLLARVSSRTALALERKFAAMMHGKQEYQGGP